MRDAPDDGAWNLAVDEAVLERYATAAGPLVPTVRLYGWSPPALSLGRGQSPPGGQALAFLRREAIDLVRRPTGGHAVLHEHERTYAVVGRLRDDPFPGGVVDTYRRIAEALLLALEALGIAASTPATHSPAARAARSAGAACFGVTAPHEIQLEGRKLIGSAQLRRRGAFLQHGSILLRADPERLSQALGGEPVGDRLAALGPRLGGTAGEAAERLDRALAGGFERRFGVRLEPGRLTGAEREAATRLRCWKYDSASWTLRGRLGERERRWGPRLP